MGAFRSLDGSFEAPGSVSRRMGGAGVKPTSCCNRASYNKTLLHSAIFVSPESTLTMEGSNGKSRFEAAGKRRRACQACG